MAVEKAIQLIIEKGIEPALEHAEIEEDYKQEIKNHRSIVLQMKRIGDLYHYLETLEVYREEYLYNKLKKLHLYTLDDLIHLLKRNFPKQVHQMSTLQDFIIGKTYEHIDLAIVAKKYDILSEVYFVGDEPLYEAIIIKGKFSDVDEEVVIPKEAKYDQVILRAKESYIPIYLFDDIGKAVICKGIYFFVREIEDNGTSAFVLRKEHPFTTGKKMTAKMYQDTLAKNVLEAYHTSMETRHERIAHSKHFPEKLDIVATKYNRSPDVMAEALHRANGVCENCFQPAPFLGKDYTPYLEIHYKTPLEQGGKDSLDNCIALCPNCHKKMHYEADVVTVITGVIYENHKVLIAQRAKGRLAGRWEFPGGKAEHGESFEQTLIREFKEELNVTVEVQSYLGEAVFHGDEKDYRVLTYLCKRVSGEYELRDHNSMKFVTIDELSKYKFGPAHKQMLQDELTFNKLVNNNINTISDSTR